MLFRSQASGIVPDIIVENTSPPDAKGDDRKRPVVREENLPGHLQNQQAPQESKDKDKEKEAERPVPPMSEMTPENDAQLRRALELLKGLDMFKQVMNK